MNIWIDWLEGVGVKGAENIRKSWYFGLGQSSSASLSNRPFTILFAQDDRSVFVWVVIELFSAQRFERFKDGKKENQSRDWFLWLASQFEYLF